MMDNIKKIVEVLNDLIRINREREETYVKASRDLTPAEHNLRGVLERKAQESRKNVLQLQHKTEEILSKEGESENADSPGPGKIYNAWTGKLEDPSKIDNVSVLRSCQCKDSAAEECYEEAMREPLPDDVKSLLQEQKQHLAE